MKKLYTLGYSTTGFTPELVQEMVTELNAVVVDVRFSTGSKKKLSWTGANLEHLLGENYQHIQELGNTNFQGWQTGDKRIVIADMDKGLQKLVPIMDQNNVILFCVCPTFSRCHSYQIYEALQNAGYDEKTKPLTPSRWRKRPAVTAPLFADIAGTY